MVQNKVFAVSDLFTLARGRSAYTRAYADANPGPYPVYSASLRAPLCHVSTFDHDGTFLTWTTNGYGGRIQVISGKFSINGDRGIFFPKPELPTVPDLTYLKHILEPTLIDLAVGRVVDGLKNEYTKVGPEVAANAHLTLPVTKTGRIDAKRIAGAASRLNRVAALQKGLEKLRDEIFAAEVSVQTSQPFAAISLGNSEYFALEIGERVLKKNAGNTGVPVYSANAKKPFAHIAKSNLTNFERDSLLWGIDGNFDWNRILAGMKFATTDHCGRLLLLTDQLDSEFVYHHLQSARFNYGFDRVFRANLENIRKLVTVKVPVKKDGTFDLAAQKKLAKRYRDVEQLKASTATTLDALCSTRLDFSL